MADPKEDKKESAYTGEARNPLEHLGDLMHAADQASRAPSGLTKAHQGDDYPEFGEAARLRIHAHRERGDQNFRRTGQTLAGGGTSRVYPNEDGFYEQEGSSPVMGRSSTSLDARLPQSQMEDTDEKKKAAILSEMSQDDPYVRGGSKVPWNEVRHGNDGDPRHMALAHRSMENAPIPAPNAPDPQDYRSRQDYLEAVADYYIRQHETFYTGEDK